MRKFMKRFFITILSGAWAVALLGGCVGEPAIPVGGANATTPSASVSAPAGTDAPPVKPFLWISPFVPSDIANAVYLPQGVSKVGDKASAGIILDLKKNKPAGMQGLAEWDWKYVVVAPQWSFREDLAIGDLVSFWEGKPFGSTRQLLSILIYEKDYDPLVGLLGGEVGVENAPAQVKVMQDQVNDFSDQLSSSAWAIVPVGRVQAGYKVLEVTEGPDFLSNYGQAVDSLQGQYELYADEALAEMFPAEAWTSFQYKSTATPAASQPTPTPLVAGTAEPGAEVTRTPTVTENERVRAADGAIEIYIPAGEFMMGCDPAHNGGYGCFQDELPLREVYLDAYTIDKFEVTNRQYALCVQAGACPDLLYKYSETRPSYYGNPTYDNYPVVAVSWSEANAFCQWVGGSLPTSAQWEKAAHGEESMAYPWGDELPNCGLSNTFDEKAGKACVGDTSEVGSYPDGASPYGVLDMAGNVWEWNSDWYDPIYLGMGYTVNPTGPEQGNTRMVHGGSWDYSSAMARSVYNSNHIPNSHLISFGFRCAGPAN